MTDSPSASKSLIGNALERAGLREAHAHLAAYGQSLTMPSLAACGSVGECLDLVRREAAAARGAPRAFLRMTSARVEAWAEGRWPTLRELDDAAGDVPVVIMSFDHHAAAANSAAMAAAGLRAGAAVPPNGVVCVDDSGEATGVLLEHAAYAAWGAAPEPSERERASHVREAARALAAMGFSEVHDLHSQAWLGPALAAMERAGELPLDVRLYVPAAELERAAAGRGAWESERVRLAGGKVFADGTLNSRTALMLTDYADPLPGLPRGKAMVSEGELDEAVGVAMRLGLGLSVHAIGDGAVRMVLDAYERGGVGRGRDRQGGAAFRIEHCEVIDGADVGRFAALGVVCSVQPCHLLADVEALRRYLPHRLDRVLPLRELIDSGCRPGVDRGDEGLLWFGSDVPIVRADPGDSIAAATMRRREGMEEGEAVAPGQRISEEEAWAGFGSGSRGWMAKGQSAT